MRGIKNFILNTLSIHDRGEWLKMLFASIFFPILPVRFSVWSTRAPPFLSELTNKSINGRSVCSTEKLYLISQYLNTSADYLLSGNKSEDILHQLSVVLDGKSEKELERARRVLVCKVLDSKRENSSHKSFKFL